MISARERRLVLRRQDARDRVVHELPLDRVLLVHDQLDLRLIDERLGLAHRVARDDHGGEGIAVADLPPGLFARGDLDRLDPPGELTGTEHAAEPLVADLDLLVGRDLIEHGHRRLVGTAAEREADQERDRDRVHDEHRGRQR